MNVLKIATCLLCIATTGLYTACTPDEFGDGNGLGDPNVNAAFTVTPVSGKLNTYLVNASVDDVVGFKWDFGDGAGSFAGPSIDTIFYPDAGDYAIILTAIGRGGLTSTAVNTVSVETSDPNSGNLVVGGKMEAGDDDNWETVTYSDGVTFSLIEGKMVATGGNWGHAGIYQALEIEGGKKYKVDMIVSGSGATDTWFEVYVGKAAPVPGVDYSDGGKRLALNTWAGCGNSSFNGKLSALSCDGTNGGEFTFEEGGTVYLMIRGGGANLGTSGISIDNVEIRGVN